MRLLIVEDNEENIALFESELAKDQAITAVYARSRDAAMQAIDQETFDLIVLDLKIPTADSRLDEQTDHGLAVHAFVREKARGTPILVFSAFGNIRLATNLTEKSDREDIWGVGEPQQLTQFREKSDFAECLAYIQQSAEHQTALANIEISSGLEALELTHDEKKVVRLFARLKQGVAVRVAPLAGGLSSSRTLRLNVEAADGTTWSNAVVKLGPLGDVEKEWSAYNKFVAPVIDVGGFAHAITLVRAGAAGVGGIFYGFAQEYDTTLTTTLLKNPDAGPAIVDRLRKLEAIWQAAVPAGVTVGDVRRLLVSDEAQEKNGSKLEFDWRELEKREVRIKVCRQHCDLHGLNVLIKGADEPLIIDYSEIRQAPASLDPIVLEMSLVFHPAFAEIRNGWPTVDQAKRWYDLEIFAANCPLHGFLRACRKWAHDAEAGDKGVLATAYGYAVRQFNYVDTNHEIAAAIAFAANERLMQS
jgi:CheY-like chemotaxis protein